MNTKTKHFSLDDWRKALDNSMHSAKYLGTRSADPLVRWSEVGRGPLRICAGCHGVFTPLGLPRHQTVCATKQESKS
jgi:hypothetical protein